MNNYTPSIAIIGPGAWGSALAQHLSAQEIILVGNKAENNTSLPPNQRYTNHLDDSLTSAGIIIATPSKSVPGIIQYLAKQQYKNPVLCASKGLASINQTSYLFHELAAQSNLANPLGYLSGPTFAHELTHRIFTCAVITGADQSWWHALLHKDYLRITNSDDPVGVALSSLYKNVAAMLAGCCQPPILGENIRALLLGKALEALTMTIKACQGNPQTALGPAGAGDIILSGTSMASRNYQFGYNLAHNIQHPTITTESLANLEKLHQYLEKRHHNCDLIHLARQVMTTPSLCKEHIQTWLAN